MIRKAVIPAAGLGTRLLPATKQTPKEMLPVFVRCINNLRVKPILQVVFEELHDRGFKEFCFIVGRSKRSVEDHFTPDSNFSNDLEATNKNELATELKEFYRKINDSTIVFMNQPEPKGFGDAVYRAKPFTLNEPFLVHVGDDLILSSGNSHIKRLINTFEEMNADAVLLVQKVKEPRKYGVITGVELKPRIYRVTNIVEKPKKPPSNIATIAIYVFNSKIYKEIERVKPDESGEVQLTDAIRNLILSGGRVYAVELSADEKRIDIGTPESYWNALKETFLASTR